MILKLDYRKRRRLIVEILYKKRKMILKRIEVEVVPGHITNCYIVADEVSKEAMIVDPRKRSTKDYRYG